MKGIMTVAILLALTASCFAIEQPQPVEPMATIQIFDITPPVPPIDSECLDLYSTSNSRCSGDIRLYDYCAPTMGETGLIEPRSENCRAYGETWVCQNNDCIDLGYGIGDSPQTIATALIGLAIAGFVLYVLFGKKKGRRSK